MQLIAWRPSIATNKPEMYVVSQVLPYTTPKRTYNQDPYHKYLTKGLKAGFSTLSLSNLAKSPKTKKGSKA